MELANDNHCELPERSAIPADTRAAYEQSYGRSTPRDWAFHHTQDPLVRYLRDRRIRIALDRALKLTGRSPGEWDALVVCGGVGGEGTYLMNRGCRSVTVSDFAERALELCRERDPRLNTRLLDAEAPDVAADSFDLVLVQDGLHELSRPTLGLTEMLRISREVIIVIEPHRGLVARLFGTTWEGHEGVANYVFRWTGTLLQDVVRSYCRSADVQVTAIRLWDHNVVIGRMARLVGGGAAGLALARMTYTMLDTAFSRLGNMMIGIVVKPRAANTPRVNP